MTTSFKPFLSQHDLRPTGLRAYPGLKPRGLIVSEAGSGCEIAVFDAQTRPNSETIRKAWKERWGGRPISLLVIVLYDGHSTLCGHTSNGKSQPPVYHELAPANVEKICEAALLLDSGESVQRFLREQLPEAESPIFGIRNQGLLATHVIQRGEREFEHLPDLWKSAGAKADSAAAAARTAPAAERERRLLKALGWSIDPLSGPASLLTDRGTHHALAIFLEQGETAEVHSKRFPGDNPISYALTQAQERNLRWVIVARGSELRLYPTDTRVGVGRRGTTNTFIQINSELVAADRLPFLWLTFSPEALAPEGVLTRELLERSDRYAKAIGDRLRDRIYDRVIPKLAMAIAAKRKLKKPSKDDLDLTYQMAMLVLFRLLFIAYAEDHDLLPYKSNDVYHDRSITHLTRELKAIKQKATGFAAGTTRWDEMAILWQSIREGNSEWGIPPYDGGLFDEDGQKHAAGANLKGIQLSNRDFGEVLTNLLLDENTPEGLGPVDFRALGVREFGTIYEGLLENEISVADLDLATYREGVYKPSDSPEKTKVRKGEYYLHTRSGARKSSGSYYTKEFAVEHLLDHSLEPALDEHLARVEAVAKSDPDRAATQLFEFYVADIAMGSGHFLIHAVDHIEKRFLTFLESHKLPGVDAELAKLRQAGEAELRNVLGSEPDPSWLEKNRLLRRQIARRCIFGVDLNPLAVELARLSVWIHTFVPGLPLSFLDHNLVCGNSLVGIATFDEMLSETINLGGDNLNLFENPIREMLGRVESEIRTLREKDDANISDIQTADRAHEDIRAKLAGTSAYLDILAAARFDKTVMREKAANAAGMGLLTDLKHMDKLAGNSLHTVAMKALQAIPPFHFPIAFPEIFLREDRPGFDVIIGNPPWEKARVEEHGFWARHFPGLRGMKQSDQEVLKKSYRKSRPDLVGLFERETESAERLREILVTGPYPGMGTGDPDLYKAFCWRFWSLLRNDGGRLGVVLPRSAWFVKGSAEFRMAVFAKGSAEDLTALLNTGGWVFDDAEPRYTITLSSILKRVVGSRPAEVRLRGPIASNSSFNRGATQHPVRFTVRDVLTWTDSASLPLLPSEESAEVFLQLRKAPRLDADARGWRCRPHTELHATNDKKLMTFTSDPPKGYWPVFKGESFDIWTPDTGKYYAFVDPDRICAHLQQKRENGHRNKRSVFSEFPKEWIDDPSTLPCLHPRIAFRDITNRTNRRTVLAALVPPEVVITHKGPHLLWPSGDQQDVAFVLAALCTLPLDWYARCFIEVNLTYHVLNPLPIPQPSRGSSLWRRTVELSGRLACPDKRFATWAKSVGVKCGPLADDEKTDMIAELDAVVAHLYGLSEKQLRHIFETFHESDKWKTEMETRLPATLRHFGEWKGRA